jgi:hypothetical protein
VSLTVEDGYAHARPLLSSYLNLALERRLAFVAALRPTRAELDAIFAPEFAADAAEHGYRQLWGNAPVWPVPPTPQLELTCAISDAFADEHGRDTRPFPGGYHEISSWLRKNMLWVAWSIRGEGPSESHFFDGLVMIAPERWVWCPRPWKVLPRPRIEALSWWDD